MAIAEKWLAARYNKPDLNCSDHRIYALLRRWLHDGRNLERGSLVAGHLKLDNLCWIYDNNHITIEGKTGYRVHRRLAGRFLAYGWNVVRVGDANDLDRIETRFGMPQGRRQTHDRNRPVISLWFRRIVKIQCGAMASRSAKTRSKLVKQAYGLAARRQVLGSSGVYEHLQSLGLDAGPRSAPNRGRSTFAEYRKQFPELAAELDQFKSAKLPGNWSKTIPVFPAD